jgi:serine/threonine-protein kinase
MLVMKAGIRSIAGALFFATVLPLSAWAEPLPRFPAQAPWYEDVGAPDRIHPNSAAMIAHLESLGGWGTNSGADHGRFQIDFSMKALHAGASAPLVTVLDYPYGGYYGPDCDAPGGTFPLPEGGSIEGSSDYSCDNAEEDCHLLVVRGDELFEAYHANLTGDGLEAQCALRWDLRKIYPRTGRGEQCTSVDAAGFPVAPLLFNADEVWNAIQTGRDLGHAIRFILPNARMAEEVYVHPATHAGAPADPGADAIPYGSRLRLRASFDIDGFSTNPAVRVILRSLKKYGMLLADGGNVPLTAEADTYTTHQWDDPDIALDSHSLFGIRVDDFEVVQTGDPIDLTYDCVRTPGDFLFIDGYEW